MGPAVVIARTWADAHGVWHARVSGSTALIAARRALRDALVRRQAPGTVAREVWLHPVRVPELDDDNGKVYRERLDTDESVEVERARAELDRLREEEHEAIRAADRAIDARRAAWTRLVRLTNGRPGA